MNLRSFFKLNMDKDVSPLNTKRILIGIILLGAVLRFWGIWHGYPYSYYPDEAHFVKRALSFGSGDLNPHLFHKPAFYMYLLFFEFGVFYLIGKIVGLWHQVNDFAVFYIKNPGPFYIIGRVTTTIFSVGSILFTYLAAKQLFNRKAGLIAALLLALTFGHVMVAKDIKADTPAMFFTIASAYFLVLYMRDKTTKYVLLSAIFAGIGTAVKYYSNVMLVPVLIAILLCWGRLRLKSITKCFSVFVLCLLAFYLTYFICAPYNFIDPLGRKTTFRKYVGAAIKIKSLLEQSRDLPGEKETISGQNKNQEASIDAFTKENVLRYVSELRKGLGLVIFAALLLGLFIILFNLSRMNFVFLIFPILFSLISELVLPGYSEIRHQIVLYPFMVVCSALFFVKMMDLVGADKRFGYATLLILLIPFYQIISYNHHVSKEDTRNIAKKWIEAEIPPGSKILTDENGPPLFMNEERIIKMMKLSESADPKGQFTAHYHRYLKYMLMALKDSISYNLYEIRFPWWLPAVDLGVHTLDSQKDKDMGNPLKTVGVENYEYYVQNKFDYAIVHSQMYKRHFKDGTVSRNFPAFAKFYRDLFERGVLIKEFSNENGKIPGPVIKIFKFR